MARFNFPTSPSNNQTYTANSVTWKWNGHAWKRVTGVGAPTGPQGAQGVQGSQGHQGIQGAQGRQGADGAQGAQGVQGNQGYQGHQGVQGAQGKQGALGAQGSQGVLGAQGNVGNQGHQGRQGAQGVQGTSGQVGTLGAQGHQGVQGAGGLTTTDADTLDGQHGSYYRNYNNLTNKPISNSLLYIDVYGNGNQNSRDTARGWATSAVSVPNNCMFSVRWRYYHQWWGGNGTNTSDEDVRTLWYKNNSGTIYWAAGR